MDSAEYAVSRLTEHHSVMTDAGEVTWPPLLVWLNDAVTEQVKRGQAGSGGTGSPINTEALVILQRIEAGMKQMRQALYLPPMRDLMLAVPDTWGRAQTYRHNGELEDQQWERICDAFPKWVADIEAEWDDRTRRMEVIVPCPSCGERWILEADENDKHSAGTRRSAIVVEWAEGRAPTAECRAADCGLFQVGWEAVARLGFTIGAEQNLEILKACGIDLGQSIADSLQTH